MRVLLNRRTWSALARIEVLVLLMVVAIGIALLAAARANARTKAQRIACLANLKCVGISFRLFATDHQDRFPMRVSTNDGGSLEFVPGREVTPHFRPLLSEGVLPRMLTCPADRSWSATDFSALRGENVSYFLNLEAEETTPQVLLLGDRLMEIDGKPARGVVPLTQNSRVRWMPRSHRVGAGNVSLADGSVRKTTNASLQRLIRVPDPGGTNRLAFP